MYLRKGLEWRKCGMLLVLILILALAFLVGTMFGHYIFGEKKKLVQEIPPFAKEIPPFAKVNTPSPIVYVPNTFEVKFELDSIGFTSVLADHSSQDFKSLTRILEEKLRDPISFKYDDHFTLKLIKFESSPANTTSSTVRIRWLEDEDNTLGDENEKTISPTIRDVTEQITQYINVRDGFIGGHHIVLRTLNVEKLFDKCKNNGRSPCTHSCDFQTTTLMFKCSCPDTLILQNNNCVDRSSFKPTEKPKQVNIARFLEITQEIGGVISDIRYENEKLAPLSTPPPTTTPITNGTTPTPPPTTTPIINGTIPEIPESAGPIYDNATFLVTGTKLNNSIISINETGSNLEKGNATTNSTDEITEEPDFIIYEININSSTDKITEKNSSHKKSLDDKENTKYFMGKNSTFLEDFIQPGSRMEDIASFTNISISNVNVQNTSSLVLGDSHGYGHLQNESSSSNTSKPMIVKSVM